MFVSRRDLFGFVASWPLLSMYVSLPKISWNMSFEPIQIGVTSDGWKRMAIGLCTVRIGEQRWTFQPQDVGGAVMTEGPFKDKPVDPMRRALYKHLEDICMQLETRQSNVR